METVANAGSALQQDALRERLRLAQADFRQRYFDEINLCWCRQEAREELFITHELRSLSRAFRFRFGLSTCLICLSHWDQSRAWSRRRSKQEQAAHHERDKS